MRLGRVGGLSDVDVVWISNPFTLPSLYRDSDVEGMTDGWDDASAFGYEWPGRTGTSLRLSARNSGLFYLRASEASLRMMTTLKGRMEREGYLRHISPPCLYISPPVAHLPDGSHSPRLHG